MAIDDNRIFNTNMEEIFLLQSMDGGGSGGGGSFNGKYISINSALNQVHGFNSLSIGKDNISATARTFTFGRNNINLFDDTLILGDENIAVETQIYYDSFYDSYGTRGGKIINGKNNVLYKPNTAGGLIINGEDNEGGEHTQPVVVYVSAAGTEYNEHTNYYERTGMGTYVIAYPTSSTYQDFYIAQTENIPLDSNHVFYGYFDTEGHYIFYKDTTFTEAYDFSEIQDAIILYDINTNTKEESVPYAKLYYYYQTEYYILPFNSESSTSPCNSIINGKSIKNNTVYQSILNGSSIEGNTPIMDSLISGYSIRNGNFQNSIIGGSILNNIVSNYSIVYGSNIQNIGALASNIIGNVITNGNVQYSTISGSNMSLNNNNILYTNISGSNHNIKGKLE